MITCPGCCKPFSKEQLLQHAYAEHPKMQLEELHALFAPEQRAAELDRHVKALRDQAEAAAAEATRLRGG